MKPWAAYCRVSTDEQATNQTIDIQLEDFRKYGERTSRELAFYVDNGVSGEVPLEHRSESGGPRLLSDLNAGKFADTGVLVWRCDRIGREVRVALNAIGEIEKHTVCESVTEGVLSLKDPAKILTTSLFCGMSGQEKAIIRSRTMKGSLRAAEAGIWLGGIVPYGYRKVGEKKEARIEPSTQPIPGLEKWTEVKVVQRIYTMASQGKSCIVISDYLNEIGVPPAYHRDAREVLRGKRKQRTTGLWRPSRVRNMLVQSTYRGIHVYGKREVFYDAKHKAHLKVRPPDQWIERPCIPLVDEDLWRRANVALNRNQIAAMAHAKNQYLLRGLIRCGQCGLTYCAAAAVRPSGKREYYYRCGARYRRYRGAGKCDNPSVRGEDLDRAVWAQVAKFLARPAKALRELEKKMKAEGMNHHRVADDIKDIEAKLAQKAQARQRVLRLYGSGRLSDDELDQELERLKAESSTNEARLTELRKLSAEAETRVLDLDWAGRWLGSLGDEIHAGELTFDKKRRAIETLVAGITVHATANPKEPKVEAHYYFGPDSERFEEYRRISSAPDYTLMD